MKEAIHIKIPDLLEQQAAAEATMLEEFHQGDFTASNPLIKCNPYIVAPCAAVILFKTKKEVSVTITVRGKTPAASIRKTFPKAKEHILPVLGLYHNYLNTIDIQLYQGDSYSVQIQTEETKGKPAGLNYMKTSPSYLQGDLIFVTPPEEPDRLTGFDYAGDIRWYADPLIQNGFKRAKNGHLLIGAHRTVAHPYFATGLYEMDLVGKIYKEFFIPGAYHHDLVEMDNGDLLVLTEEFGAPTVEDVCILLDRETGEIKKSWDFKDFITPGDGGSGLKKEADWFHANSVFYDKNTSSLTFSGRHVDAIVNIDYETGKLNWIFGDPEGWSEEKQKYFFKPVENKPFDWMYAQHDASILPDGTVVCFDNGTLRSKNKDKFLKNKDNFSRGVRYKIDTEKMTIEQVWEFGRQFGHKFFS